MRGNNCYAFCHQDKEVVFISLCPSLWVHIGSTSATSHSFPEMLHNDSVFPDLPFFVVVANYDGADKRTC